MSSATTTLPPPLSDAPSVETLERLLVGLHQPMHRGVPTPPLPAGPQPAAARSPAAGPMEAPVGAVATPAPPPLSWSAGSRDRGVGTRATALGVAVVAAAGVLAGFAAAGEIPLP